MAQINAPRIWGGGRAFYSQTFYKPLFHARAKRNRFRNGLMKTGPREECLHSPWVIMFEQEAAIKVSKLKSFSGNIPPYTHSHISKHFVYCSQRKNFPVPAPENGNACAGKGRGGGTHSLLSKQEGNISSYRIMKFLGSRNKIDCLISEVCSRLKNTYGAGAKSTPREIEKYGGSLPGICPQK